MIGTFFATLEPMLTLFLCIAIGFIARKTKILPDNASKVMAKLETWVFFPALSFSTMAKNCTVDNISTHAVNVLFGVVSVALGLGIAIPLGKLFIRTKCSERGIYTYALAFANGGYVVQPYAIEKIITSRGKVVYRAPKTKSSHQLSMSTAAEMTAMLKTVIQYGTGRGANIGKPAAGKTGTTDDYKDASFIGYTPNIVTGVWVGKDDNTEMKNVQGGSVPAVIWRDIMKVATEPYGKADFNYPEIKLVQSPKSGEEVIGGETPAKEEEEEKEETSSNNNEVLPNFDIPKQNHSEQAAPVQTPDLSPKTTPPAPKPAAPTPKPAAPAPTPARAPIPMATP